MAEPTLTQELLYRARPTLRFAGQAAPRVVELLQAMRMDEQEGGLSALELRLSNWASLSQGADLAFDGSSNLQLGRELQVGMGDEAQPLEIFSGAITALELACGTGMAPEIVLLAEDRLQSARLARRSRTFTDLSPAEVVRQVASGLGLACEVSGLDSPRGIWVQLAESDLAFLRRLLAPLDADLQVVDRKLQVAPRGMVQRNLIELQLHGQLGSARVRADLAEQATRIEVRGWDAGDGRAVQASISGGRQLGPGRGGRTGPQILSATLGERPELLSQVVATSQGEATALAQAAFDQRARRFVRVDGTAEGNPRLRVGSHVQLSGLDPRFNNTYYVTRACHLYDLQHGYRTEFSAECAHLG